MNSSYIIIPSIAVLVSYLGRKLTSIGIDSGWYNEIAKPPWTPPNYVFNIAWTMIFIGATLSALHVYNKFKRDNSFYMIMNMFWANAFLTIAWSYIFFVRQDIFGALIESVVLGCSVLMLIALIRKRSKPAALLLVPYAGWIAFATYLTYKIYLLNLV